MSRKHNKYGKPVVVNVPIDPKTTGGFVNVGKIPGTSEILFIRARPNN